MDAVEKLVFVLYACVVVFVVGVSWWVGTAGYWQAGMAMLAACFCVLAFNYVARGLRK